MCLHLVSRVDIGLVLQQQPRHRLVTEGASAELRVGAAVVTDPVTLALAHRLARAVDALGGAVVVAELRKRRRGG